MSDTKTNKSGLSRRGFIGSTLAAAAGVTLLGNEKEKKNVNVNTKAGKLPEIKEFRTLGRTGFKASDIGFGAGALTNPAVLETALDMGVNYIDTAEHYVGGKSESTIGEVIKKRGDRKKIFITTKLSFNMGTPTKDDLKSRFAKCLERMQTDYADCLMIHMAPVVSQLKHEPFHQAAAELKKEGKLRFVGLSNHGSENSLMGLTPDAMDKVFKAAADDGRFDVALLVYNFLYKDLGEQVLKSCKAKNIGTTLMKTNPVQTYEKIKKYAAEAKQKGQKIPDAVVPLIDVYKDRAAKGEEFTKKYGLKGRDAAAKAAIRFCLDNPDVHSVCPSFNNFADLEAHVALSGTRLKPAETALLKDYEDAFHRFYCRHACGKCQHRCPHGIPVNDIMRYDHYFNAQGREKHAMELYAALKTNNARACENCNGFCQQACPYGVPVQGLLSLAHQTLTLT